MKNASRSERREHSVSILRYAFSDVFKRIQIVERRKLIKEINNRRAIFSAREMRRLVSDVYLPYTDGITAYLTRKNSPENINITLLLLSTHPRVVSAMERLIDGIAESYTSTEIARLLLLNPDDVSKRVYDFERSKKGNLIFEDKRGMLLRLVVDRSKSAAKSFRIVIDDKSQHNYEKIEKILFDVNGSHSCVAEFLEKPESFRLRDIIENWSPEVFVRDGGKEHFLDAYLISRKTIRCVRYYVDGQHTTFIFDKEVASVPRPEP